MSFFFLFCLLTLTSCNSRKNTSPQNKARLIIDASVKAHGGMVLWKKTRALRFTKKIILYSTNGAVEKEIIQENEFGFTPFFTASLSYKEPDGTPVRLHFDGKQTTKYYGDSLVTDSTALKRARNSLEAAFFVIAQPFKLTDKGVEPVYLEETRSNLNSNTEVIQILPNEKDSLADKWWYYFDAKSKELVANKVLHKNRYSLIENLEFTDVNGLLLHKHRKSYFTESLLTKKTLRAEYWYYNFKRVE